MMYLHDQLCISFTTKEELNLVLSTPPIRTADATSLHLGRDPSVEDKKPLTDGEKASKVEIYLGIYHIVGRINDALVWKGQSWGPGV